MEYVRIGQDNFRKEPIIGFMSETRVGLSLSGCVLDIINGRVRLEDVAYIISACDPHPEHGGWEYILSEYERLLWSGRPEAWNVAVALIGSGRVFTPRSQGLPMPDLTRVKGFWLE